METNECLALLRAVRDCAFATIDRDGMPYVIGAAHCLHCGLCYESCPVEAIERLG